MSSIDQRKAFRQSKSDAPVIGFGTSTTLMVAALVVYLLSIPSFVRVIPQEFTIHEPETGKKYEQITTASLGSIAPPPPVDAPPEYIVNPEPQTFTLDVPPEIPITKTPPINPNLDWGSGNNAMGIGLGFGDGPVGPVGGFGDDTLGSRTVKPEVVEPFVEFPDEEPQIDMDELASLIKYPDVALKNRIEGTVVVKVLIGSDGKIRSLGVHTSSNALLNSAALKGVSKATFTPGKQNGYAVKCWVYVPVSFKLR